MMRRSRAIRRPALDCPATVPGLLARAVERFGDHECVVTLDERVTYREIDTRSRHLARRMLRYGVGKGTRVGTDFPYGVEWLVSWLATARAGAVHFPFSTAYKPAELRKSLRHGDVLPEGRSGSMGWLIDGVDVRIADAEPGKYLPDDSEGAKSCPITRSRGWSSSPARIRCPGWLRESRIASGSRRCSLLPRWSEVPLDRASALDMLPRRYGRPAP